MKTFYLTGAILVLALAPGAAQLCSEWAPAVPIGELPPQLRESSGIAASRQYADRLYHVNDSGDRGRFYVTALNGSQFQTVQIADFRPRDTEAMSLAPCRGSSRRSCIYVGDIGDNNRRRTTIEVIAIEEMERFEATANAIARLTLRYPDGPHDAESMAVDRDGTVFILTKERPARLFRANSSTPQQTLEAVATLDAAAAPTDMAISDDGMRVMVLTYKGAVEFSRDFKEQRTVPLLLLPQQESATYLPGGRSFVFTTERVFLAQPQPLMRQECRTPQ